MHFAGGESFVGTDRPYHLQDEEGPRRSVTVAPFSLERAPVTNQRFSDFVRQTGYVTEAERFGWAPVFAKLLGARADDGPLREAPWWIRVDGAFWSSPGGPGTSTEGRETHPVVQVSWSDAAAFAAWSGGRLPDEAEWEFAARGNSFDPRFPWGDAEPDDQAAIMANIWQGAFPDHNSLTGGYLGTSPVGAFPANGAGLVDMAGNVWEWTADPFRRPASAKPTRHHPGVDGEMTLKGGSFLCHRSYCYRYRIAARMGLTPESCASNVGFRVAYDGRHQASL